MAAQERADKPKDSHPADGILESIKGLFNGDNLKQAVRGAWDHASGQQPQPSLHDQQAAAATKNSTDAAVQRANKQFLDADQAAKIRAQVNKK